MSSAQPARFGYDAKARGETEGSFAMSQLAGIVSLFLIGAAFLTSCDSPQPPTQGQAPPLLQGAE